MTAQNLNTRKEGKLVVCHRRYAIHLSGVSDLLELFFDPTTGNRRRSN